MFEFAAGARLLYPHFEMVQRGNVYLPHLNCGAHSCCVQCISYGSIHRLANERDGKGESKEKYIVERMEKAEDIPSTECAEFRWMDNTGRLHYRAFYKYNIYWTAMYVNVEKPTELEQCTFAPCTYINRLA